MPDNNSTNDEELDFAAEIIQNAGFLYLEKKRLSNESEKKLTQLKIKIKTKLLSSVFAYLKIISI